jgi:hypothetical protein
VESLLPPLRVGVVVSSLVPPAWIVRAIESIAESPHAVLAAVVRGDVANPPAASRGLLASLYRRLDAKRFRTRDDALDPHELALAPNGEATDVDVLVLFDGATTPARGRVATWSLELPDGLWELTTQQTHTTSVLKNVEDGTIVATARVATDPISLHRAMNRLRWKSAALVPRALRALRTQAATPEVEVPPPSPRHVNMLAPLVSIAGRYAMQKVRDVAMLEQWFVAFRFRDSGEDPLGDLRSFHRLEPPKDRLWADPFVIKEGDRAWIFVEEMLFVEGRGTLAVIEARRDGSWSPPVRILERPYHLSYPCVFRWEGAFYMVPESGGSGTVQLLQATHFPHRWEPVAVLLRDLEAVDATPFEHGGRWWMYLTTASTPNVYDELSLYVADTPLGPWTPHRLNPILSDLAGGRCAGRPFRRNGTLVRAAQDGAKRYGHSMQLRELVTLDDHTWQERVISRIEPDWAPRLAGTHTFNVDGEVGVVDGVRDVWRRG